MCRSHMLIELLTKVQVTCTQEITYAAIAIVQFQFQLQLPITITCVGVLWSYSKQDVTIGWNSANMVSLAGSKLIDQSYVNKFEKRRHFTLNILSIFKLLPHGTTPSLLFILYYRHIRSSAYEDLRAPVWNGSALMAGIGGNSRK